MSSPGYTTIACKSAKELWDLLSPEIPLKKGPAEFIYRGQSNATWELVPSALRNNSPIPLFIAQGMLRTEVEIMAEMELLKEFVRNCDSLGLNIPQDSIVLRRKLDTNARGARFIKSPSLWPSSDLVGLLALAQHHGVPTRLLDWSRRSHVAAYFAASSALACEKHWTLESEIAVWALDALRILPITPVDEPAIIGRFPNITIITAPGAVTANLAAQAGLFTLLRERGARGTPLQTRTVEGEFVTEPESPLWKLTLPVKHCLELLELCRLYSISASTLFPRYDGAGAAVLEATMSWRTRQIR